MKKVKRKANPGEYIIISESSLNFIHDLLGKVMLVKESAAVTEVVDENGKHYWFHPSWYEVIEK